MTWEDILPAERRERRRLAHGFPCGVKAYRQNRSLIVVPPTKRWRALSNGAFNGGFMDSPKAVTNTTSLGGSAERHMMASPREEHMRYCDRCAAALGLDPEKTVGLGTAAHMDNAAFGYAEHDGIGICAAVTGGIRGNGGRAGDPSSWDEAERYRDRSGTIVIILAVCADLPDSALLGAMTTATEAKTAVLTRLQGRSLYSTGVATGSGTDQVAVMCDKGSKRKAEAYRTGSGLAKAIKRCVEETLAEALDLQSGMSLSDQCNPYVAISRYKITEMSCHEQIRYPFTMKVLREGVKRLSSDAKAAATASAALHIMDEVGWGLIPAEQGRAACRGVLRTALSGPSSRDPVLRAVFEKTSEPEDMLRVWMAMLLYDEAAKIKAGGS